VETTSAGERGDIVVLNGSEKLEGDLGLLRVGAGWVAIRQIAISPMVYKCAESGADIRLLGVPPRADGSRVRLAWREVVPLLVENNVSGWLLDGPRTVLWCCQFIDRKRGGPVEHYNAFISFYRLNKDDYGVSHYENIMKMLEHLGCWDQLNLPDLVGVELAMRQAQLYEYIYSMEFEAQQARGSGGSAPVEGDNKDKSKRGRGRGGGLHKFGILDEAAVFTGAAKDDGRSMICPTLLEHVSKQVERDAGILKQIRKAREERRALSS